MIGVVNSMEIKEFLVQEKKMIEDEIEEFFRSVKNDSMDDPLVQELLDSLKEFTLRDAKRVRAILVVLGYMAVGGKDFARVRKAAVSLELIQTMLLIHDDIMDRSDMRRGAPSFHRVYSRKHRENSYLGDPDSFGTNMALIAGDLAESLGERALLRSGFDPVKIQGALDIQCEMIRDTGFGQMLDLYSEELLDWSEEMVGKVQLNKTARYTFDAPLRIGSELNGMTISQMKALEGYAVPVGIAFQIIDDILGFYGDPKRGGVEDLSDIKEGKRTLLIVKALELASDEERTRIRAALGNDRLTLEEARDVRDIVQRCGSEEYSRKRAAELTKEGLRSLEDSDLDPGSVHLLEGLAGYLIGRA